ncbi:hypothetical protein K435DRAFT_868110 [Dendrothele bispora CBS 962.96]|uniref:Uncharacterized protein n=1 Tax=Dendrothele bispora (strain CBS 962.96) TaxID=1314807 RepID=A0A4S8LCL1_DENBC|nr:hypothetical protein K435DRAFT_868110 [Dendrothele bispora CBS 962.96]
MSESQTKLVTCTTYHLVIARHEALPNAIPLNPPVAQSTYHFALEDVEDRGVFGALSHSLEVCLGQTHNDAVKKMSEADRTAFESAWLERLIKSAENQGARHPKRKHTQETSRSEGPARHKCNPDDSSVIDLSSDNKMNEDTPVVPQASASTSIPHSSELSSSAPTCPTRPFTQEIQTVNTKLWEGQPHTSTISMALPNLHLFYTKKKN